MTGLDGLLQLPGQYFLTVWDYLFHPTKFAKNHDDNASVYLNHFTFLLTNIGFTVIAFVSLSAANRASGISRGEATATFAIIAVAHATLALVSGRCAAWLLNESVEISDLLSAFCYTSIFYPVLAAFAAFLSPDWIDDMDRPAVVVVVVVQAIALVYLLATMSRFSSLFGRRLLSFSSMTAALAILAVIGLSFAVWPFAAGTRDVKGRARIQVTKAGPIGCVTLDAINVAPRSAQLLGASVGTKTQEWFDFGETKAAEFSVPSKDGIGLAPSLQPDTRYYFRYVVVRDGTACSGKTESFTTPSS